MHLWPNITIHRKLIKLMITFDFACLAVCLQINSGLIIWTKSKQQLMLTETANKRTALVMKGEQLFTGFPVTSDKAHFFGFPMTSYIMELVFMVSSD